MATEPPPGPLTHGTRAAGSCSRGAADPASRGHWPRRWAADRGDPRSTPRRATIAAENLHARNANAAAVGIDVALRLAHVIKRTPLQRQPHLPAAPPQARPLGRQP